MKDGGVGDEKLLFQAEATAYRLSMPRHHYYYTFATSGRSTKHTRAQNCIEQASERSFAVAKPKMQHHIAKPSSMQGTVRSVLGEQI